MEEGDIELAYARSWISLRIKHTESGIAKGCIGRNERECVESDREQPKDDCHCGLSLRLGVSDGFQGQEGATLYAAATPQSLSKTWDLQSRGGQVPEVIFRQMLLFTRHGRSSLRSSPGVSNDPPSLDPHSNSTQTISSAEFPGRTALIPVIH